MTFEIDDNGVCEYWPNGAPCGKPATHLMDAGGSPKRTCNECTPLAEGIGATITAKFGVVDHGEQQPASSGWGQVPQEAEFATPTESPEAKKRRQTEELQVWMEAKETLDTAKTEEGVKRQTVTSSFFPEPKKGTQYAELDAGNRLKLVHGWNFSLGDKEKTGEDGVKIPVAVQVQQLEDRINALGDEGALLAKRLIKWSPELSPTEYEKLASSEASEVEVQVKTLIDEILTVKPASPQLTYVPAKEPK